MNRFSAIKVITLLGVLTQIGSLQAQVYHVRSGASGSGNGSDWVNAFSDLPTKLVRGATYYVADGNYKGRTFEDAAAGTSKITIKKATSGEHGSSSGWTEAYGDGQAVFSGALTFDTPYYEFNGITGGGPGQWTNNFGFRVKFSGSLGTASTGIRFRKAGDYITVRHLHLEGGATESTRGNWSYGIDSEGDLTHTTVSHIWLNKLSNKGYATYGGLCEYVYFDKFYPWDGGSGYDSMHVNITRNWPLRGDVTIRYNYFTYYEPTGLITIAGDVYDNCESCRQWSAYVYGNIIDCTQRGDAGGGGAIRSFNSRGWHNRFYGFNNSFMGNKTTFKAPDSPTYQFHGPQGPIADARWFNNIYAESSIGNAPGSKSHNSYWSVTGAPTGETGFQQFSALPWVSEAQGNFRLLSGTAKGVDLTSYNSIPLTHSADPAETHSFDKDMFGKKRGADGVWDRGAIEYQANDSDASAPNILNAAVQEITASSATVTWTTDEVTTGVVEYGTSTAYGNKSNSSVLQSEHSVQLSNLAQGTVYYVRITSVDASGNSKTSSGISFATHDPDSTAPSVVLLSPGRDAVLNATVTLSARASDEDSGIAQVRFYLDDVLLGIGSTTDDLNYSLQWNTFTVPSGVHTLHVIATDIEQNDSSSERINIIVQNAGPNLTAGLVGHWTLNDRTGSVALDSSESKNHGRVTGATWTSGKLDGAAGFASASDRIDLGSLDVTGNAITLAAWVKAGAAGHDPRIISRAAGTDSDDVYWILEIDDGAPNRFGFRIHSGGGVIRVSGGSVVFNEWIHVVGVYDGASMSLYQNGQLVAKQAKTGELRTGDALAWIGNNPPDALRPFSGMIDEARIYSRALSPQEVTELFEARPPVAPAGVYLVTE